MMKKKGRRDGKTEYFWFFILMGLVAIPAVLRANNICVTNSSLTATEIGFTHVQCDVRWDNSWKASWTEGDTTVTNWDAAWIFIKYRVATNNAPWQHASLSTNRLDHLVPVGASLDVGLTGSKGTGVFLYRSKEGSGSWTNTLKLSWNFARDGVSLPVPVDVQVLAIEMVYVPKGSFFLGSGGMEPGRFYEGGGGNNPYAVTNSGPITCANAVGALWGASQSGDSSIGGEGEVSAAFPNGYNAFYCMKYEISQGQWVAFFNTLAASQKTTVDITGLFGGKDSDATLFRNTVSWSGSGDATTTTPDCACNFLDWADGTSYADWAGLRPMTELEFVKACRGPLMPAANEYAWGSSAIVNITGFSGTDGSGTETALPANANSIFDNGPVQGPVRCGIFATATSGRAASGASYWGIMEMSGNLTERAVTIGNAKGRAYTGPMGDGVLPSDGRANEVSWPAGDAIGAGLIGGNWFDAVTYLRTSDRSWAARSYSKRFRNLGFRAVRPAP